MIKNPLLKSFLILIGLPLVAFGISALIAFLGFQISPDSKSGLAKIGMGMGAISIIWGTAGIINFSSILRAAYLTGTIKLPDIKQKISSVSPNNKKTRKYWYVKAAIVILLMLLNPSYKSFQEYAAEVTTETHKAVFTRTGYYLIFSTYEKKIATIYNGEVYEYSEPEKYIGVCLNFYKRRSSSSATAQIHNSSLSDTSLVPYNN